MIYLISLQQMSMQCTIQMKLILGLYTRQVLLQSVHTLPYGNSVHSKHVPYDIRHMDQY